MLEKSKFYLLGVSLVFNTLHLPILVVNSWLTTAADGCTTDCYNSAGRGAMRVVQDARGIIVGLLARGAGKRDTSGFVIHL